MGSSSGAMLVLRSLLLHSDCFEKFMIGSPCPQQATELLGNSSSSGSELAANVLYVAEARKSKHRHVLSLLKNLRGLKVAGAELSLGLLAPAFVSRSLGWLE